MKLREKLRRINKDTDFKLSERAKAFASKVLEKNNDLEVAKAVISAVEKEEETMSCRANKCIACTVPALLGKRAHAQQFKFRRNGLVE